MSILNNFNFKKTAIVFVFSLNFLFVASLQAQQFNNYASEGLVSIKLKSDSLKIVLDVKFKEVVKLKDTIGMVKSLISLSALARKQHNYDAAFNNSGEALFLAEESENVVLIAKSNEEVGVLNYLFKQDANAGNSFKKAHENYKLAYTSESILLDDLYRSYTNLMLYYQRVVALDSLKIYIDSCEYLLPKVINNSFRKVQLNEKKAFVLTKENRVLNSIELLTKSAEELESLKEDNHKNKIDRSFLIIVYAALGKLNWKINKYDLAKDFFEKSILINDVNGEHAFYLSYVYEQLALLSKEIGETDKGFEYLKKSKEINDSFLNPRNENTQGFLTFKNRYKDQLQEKTKELNTKNLELARKTQEALKFKIMLYILFAGIIIIILLVRGRVLYSVHKKKQLVSKELIDHKNEELTKNILQLIEREEVIKELSDLMKKSKIEYSTKSVLKSIGNRSNGLWESFNNRFSTQNVGFYEELQKKAPNLSSADLKVCALIKLNFSGKEMAYLLGISLGSVHVARHRLRKKMSIDRSVNLTTFINSI